MIRKFYPLIGVILALPFLLFSQQIDVKKLEGMKPRNIGPAGMSGRVTAIDVVLSNPEVIYAGTASGGIWRSTGGGIGWEPVFDDAPVQSIGSIKINQRNPSEIWAGTGEGNPRNSQNSGEGIYKTIDGGKTWKLMGLEKTKTIHRILIHRDNPDIVYVGATGSAWGPNPDRGVFKTTDGGKAGRKVLFVNDSTGCSELVVDPTNPNKLIAAMWEYGRKPWTFNSGGKGSGIYVSFDAGETWEKRTAKDGLPKGICGLAIAPSSPNIVYALVEAKENAFYKSTGGGYKWRKMSADRNIGNRPFYYAEIYVDPKNENRIYSIHSTLTKSEDGGKTFERWVGWTVHPDHHALWISPDDPDYIIEGNDGGLNISHDRGKTWRFAENIPLGQFYHINYDMSVPYRVCGGMQDNGSWVGPSSIWKSGGIRNSDWQEVYFGDGFDTAIRPGDGRYCFAMSQGGNLAYIDIETGHTKGIKPVHPDGVELRFNWNAGFAQNPFHPCGIYYGSQFLHKSTDCGDSWEIISPDLTTNDTTKQHQDKSGGLTIDATNAENYTTIVAIAPSPMDENVIWVGTDDGNVQVTRDEGKTWTNVAANLTGSNPGSWIPYIEASQKRPNEAFVVVSDYRRNDWRPFVYFTDDYGATFTRIADETQVNGHALCVVQDPQVDDLLWLGTDFGLYFTIDFGKNWNKWTNGFPSVTTTDLKIHPRDNDLIIGTFGRAAWILDDIRPIREIARTHGKVLDEPFKVFPAPTAWLAEYRSVEGTRFAANAIYSGNNRSPMGVVTCWVKPPEKKEKPEAGEEATGKKPKAKKKAAAKEKAAKEEKSEEAGVAEGKEKKEEGKNGRKLKKDEVLVQVFNENGDTIRTFTSKVDTGIVRVRWNLRRDGVRYPSRREPKPGADLPSGYEVLPGTYKLVLTHGDYRDSTTLTVNDDPRMGFRYEKMKAKQAAYDEFYKIVEKATEGFNLLQEAKKTIKRVDGALSNAPDSLKEEILEIGKALRDSISNLEKRYMMPEGLKGIQRNPNLLSGTLWRTSSYIDASDGAPNQAARIMMAKARKDVAAILGDINRLMEDDFAAYRKKVGEVQFSLFKDFEPVKME
ncbi:MAG: WD40/YVTN/BNR-like repeat-containing protein [Saprospiraceae bacterium]